MGIAGKLASGPYKDYELVRHSSNFFCLWVGNDDELESVDSDVTYTDTDWHHLVGVCEGSNNYLYVDGLKQAQILENLQFVNTDDFAYIGKHYSNGSDRYTVLFLLTTNNPSAFSCVPCHMACLIYRKVF